MRDPAIMPRLFSKISINSYQGTGLGLFIIYFEEYNRAIR
jgi:hypothetical protein